MEFQCLVPHCLKAAQLVAHSDSSYILHDNPQGKQFDVFRVETPLVT
jgi:hypothetical protein